jgi:ankyrin repeat protein
MGTRTAVVLGSSLLAMASLGTAPGSAMPPLHTAIQRGDTSRAIQLIGKGQNVEITTVTGATPLQMAAGRGQLSVVRALVARGARIDRVTPRFGTALHQAAMSDHAEVIGWLVAQGASVEARTREEATPLYQAALDGRAGAMAALLEAGADPNAARDNGFTPLNAAAIHAAGKECLPLVGLLLDRGADPRRGSQKGWTALHIAVEEDDPAVAQALISGGADLQARGGGGRTPLEYAAERRSAAMVRLLLDSGAVPQRNETLLDLTGETHRLTADWHLERGERAPAIAQLRQAADCFEEQARRLQGTSSAPGHGRSDLVELWRGAMMDYAWQRRDGGLYGSLWAEGLNARGAGSSAALQRRAEELAAEAARLRTRAGRLEADPTAR